MELTVSECLAKIVENLEKEDTNNNPYEPLIVLSRQALKKAEAFKIRMGYEKQATDEEIIAWDSEAFFARSDKRLRMLAARIYAMQAEINELKEKGDLKKQVEDWLDTVWEKMPDPMKEFSEIRQQVQLSVTFKDDERRKMMQDANTELVLKNRDLEKRFSEASFAYTMLRATCAMVVKENFVKEVSEYCEAVEGTKDEICEFDSAVIMLLKFYKNVKNQLAELSSVAVQETI